MNGHFQTESTQVKHIIKGFNLTKSLFVSSILVGAPYTGKKTLVRYLFPTAIYADGNDQESVELLLESHDELVIFNFEKLSNIDNIDFENRRIIAIANYISNEKTIDSLFAFIYDMPSLIDRPEDIDLLVHDFSQEVKSNLMIDRELVIDLKLLDLSANIHSLKRSIYQQAFSHHCSSRDIEEILYHYLFEKMEGYNDYKDFLPLYEKPLIRAGLAKFGSQLKLSNILGINRNTLRKKIYELGID
ncbi:MAG: helix-turn-helix domain-containing protein [Campylobacterota bacterium]|nr:helix-turn-helix domain-containing protein [Campylobacterota bacterium]